MRTRPFLLLLVAFSLLPNPSPAAPPILNAVPEDAWVVVTLRDLGGLDAKLARLINPMMPIPIRPLMLVKGQLSIVQGIDETGTAAIALLPGVAGETEPTHVVMWVPTTDRAKLLAFLSQVCSTVVKTSAIRDSSWGRPPKSSATAVQIRLSYFLSIVSKRSSRSMRISRLGNPAPLNASRWRTNNALMPFLSTTTAIGTTQLHYD